MDANVYRFVLILGPKSLHQTCGTVPEWNGTRIVIKRSLSPVFLLWLPIDELSMVRYRTAVAVPLFITFHIDRKRQIKARPPGPQRVLTDKSALQAKNFLLLLEDNLLKESWV